MFSQIKLPYAFNELEPFLDAKTVEIHYTKHHANYTNNLNAALETHAPDFLNKPIEEVLSNLDQLPAEVRTAVRNNGGGFYAHNLYFSTIGPNYGGQPSGVLAAKIDETFGSFDNFKDELTQAATTQFGSGWAWLTVNSQGELKISNSPNQDNPLLDSDNVPILALDVWEHAYYLKYQNRRPDYIADFFQIINWDAVSDNYRKVVKK